LRVAPDVLWVVLTLPLIALLGLVPALSVAPPTPWARHERAKVLALAGCLGLLVNYALGMLLPRLSWVFSVECGIIGAAAYGLVTRGRRPLQELLGMGWLRWSLAAGVLLLLGGAILFESLRGWDARSIWFFAAKRLFFGGGLGGGPDDWTAKVYYFSHADYPKLLPLLGAQFAHLWGVWNEFIPKASLLMLLFPVVVGLLGLPRRLGLSLIFFAGLLLLSTKEQIWNGYADTYLCLYGVLGTVWLARWLDSGAPLDLALAGAFMGVALNLKNEGSLLLLCVVASLGGWLVLARSTHALAAWRRWPAGVWVALALPWVGFVAWLLTKHNWQLANDLQMGPGSLARMLQRLAEGKLGMVAEGLFLETDAGKSAGLLLTAAALAWALRSKVPAAAWFPAVVATMYMAGMFVVYLGTPQDVAWHMATSAGRTMLLAAFGYLGSTFLVLEAMESQVPASAAGVEQAGLKA
jgi:hypothetical protein